MDIQKLLKLTIERNASDLHLVPNHYPAIRINGQLIQLRTLELLTPKSAEVMILAILHEEQRENLMVNKELDLSYSFESYRFRVNVYFSKGTMAASFRVIPKKIKTIEELELPALLHGFTDLHQAFILVTGPTGEGKSTTLASVINEVNTKHSRHILTIEDPIEYVYSEAKSLVSQREIGYDTHAWSVSLRSALREDPDVLLIGEMRDYETIAIALTIAETGHLVFSTIHTNSASQTIDRIIDVFPAHQQNQIRIQLSLVLKAIVSQRLVPNITGTGRLPACEILINNSAISSIIREGKTHLIDNVIQTSSDEGMILLETYLYNMYMQGKIGKETALSYAIRPKEITKLIK
ncbi:MAG TPA: PilT/PilU family type 4a pilus ATPase [Patescibacteria group bacterium]|nr:PilT/PilU family type 4a pilus ATPase [Patescibacteria group bacterium]